jgi:hypothetical protein
VSGPGRVRFCRPIIRGHRGLLPQFSGPVFCRPDRFFFDFFRRCCHRSVVFGPDQLPGRSGVLAALVEVPLDGSFAVPTTATRRHPAEFISDRLWNQCAAGGAGAEARAPPQSSVRPNGWQQPPITAHMTSARPAPHRAVVALMGVYTLVFGCIHTGLAAGRETGPRGSLSQSGHPFG